MLLVQERLGCGEMNSEILYLEVLYFGKERYFCRKTAIFVGTSKSSENMAIFSLWLKIPLPLKKNSLIAFGNLGISK